MLQVPERWTTGKEISMHDSMLQVHGDGALSMGLSLGRVVEQWSGEPHICHKKPGGTP